MNRYPVSDSRTRGLGGAIRGTPRAVRRPPGRRPRDQYDQYDASVNKSFTRLCLPSHCHVSRAARPCARRRDRCHGGRMPMRMPSARARIAGGSAAAVLVALAMVDVSRGADGGDGAAEKMLLVAPAAPGGGWDLL